MRTAKREARIISRPRGRPCRVVAGLGLIGPGLVTCTGGRPPAAAGEHHSNACWRATCHPDFHLIIWVTRLSSPLREQCDLYSICERAADLIR